MQAGYTPSYIQLNGPLRLRRALGLIQLRRLDLPRNHGRHLMSALPLLLLLFGVGCRLSFALLHLPVPEAPQQKAPDGQQGNEGDSDTKTDAEPDLGFRAGTAAIVW
ncbi:uncharacterized protein PG986_011210 [Apiospora aurea]|uniref:Uncharacterized protein n=1 Tax=Apiospora aurea TaxID=335848 RepID=A0ABR1Q4D9_9PEZI